jgi:hypothetical protein
MPTPTNRTPIRVARGTYSNLNASVADIQEGEAVYATDQNRIYVKEAGVLVSTQADTSAFLDSGDIGVSVQGYDADTAKLDVTQSFTAAQRGTISAIGNTSGTITLDFATANNFSLTLNANATNTLANPTNLTAGQSGCIYISQDGSGSKTLAYASNWDFAGGTVPTLSTAASAVDVLVYAVRTTGSIAAQLIKDVK